jgi:hypothetical protein
MSRTVSRAMAATSRLCVFARARASIRASLVAFGSIAENDQLSDLRCTAALQGRDDADADVTSRHVAPRRAALTPQKPRIAIFAVTLTKTRRVHRHEVVVSFPLEDVEVCLQDGVGWCVGH